MVASLRSAIKLLTAGGVPTPAGRWAGVGCLQPHMVQTRGHDRVSDWQEPRGDGHEGRTWTAHVREEET